MLVHQRVTAHGLEAWFGKMAVGETSLLSGLTRHNWQEAPLQEAPANPPAIKHGSNSPIFIHRFMRLHWKNRVFHGFSTFCIIDDHLCSKLQRFSQPFLLVKPPQPSPSRSPSCSAINLSVTRRRKSCVWIIPSDPLPVTPPASDPLVICYIAIENGHIHRGFTH